MFAIESSFGGSVVSDEDSNLFQDVGGPSVDRFPKYFVATLASLDALLG